MLKNISARIASSIPTEIDRGLIISCTARTVKVSIFYYVVLFVC